MSVVHLLKAGAGVQCATGEMPALKSQCVRLWEDLRSRAGHCTTSHACLSDPRSTHSWHLVRKVYPVQVRYSCSTARVSELQRGNAGSSRADGRTCCFRGEPQPLIRIKDSVHLPTGRCGMIISCLRKREFASRQQFVSDMSSAVTSRVFQREHHHVTELLPRILQTTASLCKPRMS